MIPLPEKGEVRRAAEVMDARMRAACGDQDTITFNIATVAASRETDEMTSNNPHGLGGVFGDLFDVGETVVVSEPVCLAFVVDIATGRRDPLSAMASLYLNAVALGVVMERERWTRKVAGE